jgi:hypothetical protein
MLSLRAGPRLNTSIRKRDVSNSRRTRPKTQGKIVKNFSRSRGRTTGFSFPGFFRPAPLVKSKSQKILLPKKGRLISLRPFITCLRSHRKIVRIAGTAAHNAVQILSGNAPGPLPSLKFCRATAGCMGVVFLPFSRLLISRNAPCHVCGDEQQLIRS